MTGLGKHAPKQRELTEDETLGTFESWKSQLVYTIGQETSFKKFLKLTWKPKSKSQPLHGFVDGTAALDTAQSKSDELERCLGMIANFVPVISRSSIINDSTSLESIWQLIRLHYGFQRSGSHFLDLAMIKHNPNKRPETLYQELRQFYEDNLLLKDGIKHKGESLTEDEDLSPTLESAIVLRWLELIHKDLPALVKQRFCTQLQNNSLASIKNDISTNMNSLLLELDNSENLKIMSSGPPRGSIRPNARQATKPRRTCPLCTALSKPAEHFLSQCPSLPPADKKYMARARNLGVDEEGDQTYSDDDDNEVVSQSLTI